MNQNKKIVNLLENHAWEELIHSFPQSEIVRNLSFRNDLRLAHHLLYNDDWDDSLQEFAVRLLYELRKFYSQEWNVSWEYNALCLTQFYKRGLQSWDLIKRFYSTYW